MIFQVFARIILIILIILIRIIQIIRIIITIRIFFITFEEDCVKASFDFFKMPGNTSDNLLRLKDMNEEEGMAGNEENDDNDNHADHEGDMHGTDEFCDFAIMT